MKPNANETNGRVVRQKNKEIKKLKSDLERAKNEFDRLMKDKNEEINKLKNEIVGGRNTSTVRIVLNFLKGPLKLFPFSCIIQQYPIFQIPPKPPAKVIDKVT